MWHFSNLTAADNALAEKFFQQAIDLDANFAGGYSGPFVIIRKDHVVATLYQSRQYEMVLDAARQVIRSRPDHPPSYRCLAAALGQLGRIEEAKAALEKAVAIGGPSFDMYVRNRAPWWRPESYAHMIEGLRKAGWREQ